MHSPLYWNMPRYYSPVAARGIPVQRQSIPVQFVGSERSRADSAVKIQKVFRGFLVRKGVKKVISLRKEVEEIEKRIRDQEAVELIRRPESKERVKLIEGLMNLVLRLDSVRGVDPGVRDCRKFTIKKAIALQEAIDAIVAGEAVDGKLLDPTVEMKDADHEVKDSASVDISGNCNSRDNTVADDLQNHIIPDSSEVEEAEAKSPHNSSESEDGTVEENHGKPEVGMTGNSNPSLMDESGCTTQSGIQEDSAVNSPGVEEMKHETEVQAVENNNVSGRDEDIKRRDMDALQRMVEDNRRMVGLMEELVEKNERQTRLLNSLSQRVEMLERAFVCDKLRKRKKKRHNC